MVGATAATPPSLTWLSDCEEYILRKSLRCKIPLPHACSAMPRHATTRLRPTLLAGYIGEVIQSAVALAGGACLILGSVFFFESLVNLVDVGIALFIIGNVRSLTASHCDAMSYSILQASRRFNY